ncbi:MAG TPA: MFS transporter, partial [Bacteroidia bacterium]|nr:MFS transporter [Bacteroidia bacterium]
AWITDVADKKDSATAIGAFSAFQSLMLLLASAIAGTVWYLFGPEYTFMLSAVAAVVAFLMIARVKSNPV